MQNKHRIIVIFVAVGLVNNVCIRKENFTEVILKETYVKYVTTSFWHFNSMTHTKETLKFRLKKKI